MERDQLNIVIVGHVDHGKSTVMGRLLADTGALPEGRLEAVKSLCAKTAKPFEYAFLLDALKDERDQGITIDSARCFFKTASRDYIVIDAPGHIEFLKNMVTGAARAEAALLVIAADEGIQENSKRHGYLASMLGISQVTVLINKMDLVNYDQEVYNRLASEYSAFLKKLKVKPVSFIPISARNGENLTHPSNLMQWYNGPTVLEQLDAFGNKKGKELLPLRFPVQDIYKFTEEGDDRRIIAGTIESGVVSVGDEIIFLPSKKRSRVQSIEAFNTSPKSNAHAGEAIGITLEDQLYTRPGEIIASGRDSQPKVSSRLKANIFWMGRSPLVKRRSYKLKLATSRMSATVAEITHVLDASDLHMNHNKQQLDRHDVGEVIIETSKPIAFDPVADFEGTGRFVLVDNYEIAGGGIILDEAEREGALLNEQIRTREIAWEKGYITNVDRAAKNNHSSKFILFAGEEYKSIEDYARELEQRLFNAGHQSYYIGLDNVLSGLAQNMEQSAIDPGYPIRIMGELARIMTDSGMILISAVSGIDDYDLEILKQLNSPAEFLVVCIGLNPFTQYPVDLTIPVKTPIDEVMQRITDLLREKEVIPEYII
ncbi:MAG: adenylyl-sulfate kinase [Desulfatiglans sp.]|nr:adenylyl-sulfate kinase [Desulfatiglans sp.]